MSRRRGDQIANPKPIPDLGGPRASLKVSRRTPGTLEAFIHGLVVEEFDGPEPPREVLAGLAAYVRATRPEACRGTERPILLVDHLQQVEEAVALARESNGGTRRLMLAAARSTLGAIDERFQLPGLQRQRDVLLQVDRLLQAIRNNTADFSGWVEAWRSARSELLRARHRSLYDRIQLQRMIDAAYRPSRRQ